MLVLSSRKICSYSVPLQVLVICITCSWSLIGAQSLLAGEEVLHGTTTATRLNIRAKPGMKYEVVCVLKEGTEVSIKSLHEDWLGIDAPDEAAAWVVVNKIDSNRIIEDNIRVFSGPGSIFSSYAILNSGDEVEILREKDGTWAQIRPPKGAVVWAHRDYIKVESATNETRNPNFPVRSMRAKTIEDTERDRVKPLQTEDGGKRDNNARKIDHISYNPASYHIFFVGAKKSVVRKGTVIPMNNNSYPFKYALALPIYSTYYPLAYLTSETEPIEEWEWKSVHLTGSERWLKGWPRPIIQIDSLAAVDDVKR